MSATATAARLDAVRKVIREEAAMVLVAVKSATTAQPTKDDR